MTNEKCTNDTCAIHTRTDGVKHFADGEGLAAKVNYIGDYAVVTRVNDLLETPYAQIMRAFGAEADVYYTYILKVDDGTVSSLDEVGDEALYAALRYVETHTAHQGDLDTDEQFVELEKRAEEYHDGIVSAVKAGAIDLDNSVSKEEHLAKMKASVRP